MARYEIKEQIGCATHTVDGCPTSLLNGPDARKNAGNEIRESRDFGAVNLNISGLLKLHRSYKFQD